MEETETQTQKYTGYSYHGGGRKKQSESGRQRYTLSLQQFEVDLIKQKAKDKGIPASRYIMQLVNADN